MISPRGIFLAMHILFQVYVLIFIFYIRIYMSKDCADATFLYNKITVLQLSI